MKAKFLNLLLILTSLIGYLEWGKDNKSFLFQAETEVLAKLFSDPASVLHPFTLLPLFGQLILLFTLFQKEPGRLLTYIGLGCLGILLLLMFVIGLISMNFKILISTIPFLVTGVYVIIHFRKSKRQGLPD